VDDVMPGPTEPAAVPAGWDAAPPAQPEAAGGDPDVDLERAARAVLTAVLAAEPARAGALADLTRRAARLRAAVLDRHPPPVAGSPEPRSLAAEHQELAEAAGDLTAAMAAWSGTAAAVGEPSWTSGRQAAVAAAQALHDDLRVHHAHERAG
jgi:hypothetical protein